MPDYQKGKIYALRSYQTEHIYIGSTIQPLSVRKGEHKKNYKKYLNNIYGYTTSYELVKYDDYYIELLEICPCHTKEELLRKEGEFIRAMTCVNKQIAGRTKKEYNDDNKESRKIKNENNKNRYTCEICKYNTYSKTDYLKHENTIRHKSNTFNTVK
jgi:hypothetical protein